MSRTKATISLDQENVARAGALIGSTSTSAVIDRALDRVIRAEEPRRDVAAYAQVPLDDEDLAVADRSVELDLRDETSTTTRATVCPTEARPKEERSCRSPADRWLSEH